MISSSSVKDCVSCTLLHLVKARLLINYINNMHACSRFPVCYFTKIVSVQVMVLMLQEKVFQIKKKICSQSLDSFLLYLLHYMDAIACCLDINA